MVGRSQVWGGVLNCTVRSPCSAHSSDGGAGDPRFNSASCAPPTHLNSLIKAAQSQARCRGAQVHVQAVAVRAVCLRVDEGRLRRGWVLPRGRRLAAGALRAARLLLY